MAYLSDIEIAQQCQMKHITEIADKAGIDRKYLEQYGNYKAKIDLSLAKETTNPDGKLILVTAITPTPAGEGKQQPQSVLLTVCLKLAKKYALLCVNRLSVLFSALRAVPQAVAMHK